MVPVLTHATRRAWLAASLSIVARRTGLVLLAKSSRPNSDRFACGRRIGAETDRGGAKGHGQGDGGRSTRSAASMNASMTCSRCWSRPPAWKPARGTWRLAADLALISSRWVFRQLVPAVLADTHP